MNTAARFPAKLLLFGEYSILLGSSALSVPFDHFGASLKFPDHQKGDSFERMVESNRQIKIMADYFRENSLAFEKFLDLRKFYAEVDAGLYLESTIPERYGMGSSGALCAAVLACYQSESNDLAVHTSMHGLDALRNLFIRMESFFHGKSSGFDPLVSFLKTPLFLREDGVIKPVEFAGHTISGQGIDILLVDTGQPCSTGPLVKNFLARFAAHDKVNSPGRKMCSLVNTSITRLLDGDMNPFWNQIRRLSEFQFGNLSHLITDSFRPVWADGLQTGFFTMKLCGSGGGGFLLCFTRQKEAAVNYFNEKKIPVICCFPSSPFS